MNLFGCIKNIDKNGLVTIDLKNLSDAQKTLIRNNLGTMCGLEVEDGRTITPRQRRKIFAFVNEIDEWCGYYNAESTRKVLEYQFMADKGYYKMSLSNCSIAMANDFIEWLIVFCLNNHVEFSSKILDEIKGDYGWELHCLEAHVCCICGKPAQYAHWWSVGIGRDRNKINHVGNRIMALCAICHQKQHSIGLISFIKINQLKGVPLTKDLAIKLKLETKKTYEKSQNLSNYEFERQESINMYRRNYND